MSDTKASIELKLDGADAASQGLKGVADAQGKVGDSAKKMGGAFDAAVKAQAPFNVSNEDLASVLNKIAPGLGELFQTIRRGSNVIGELAGKNLSLIETFNILKNGIRNNADSFKLLLAGGAVAAGIYAIQQALAAQASEHDRVTKAMERQKKAADDLENKRRDLQQTIEDVSDERPGGGMTDQQSRAAIDTAQQIREKFPFLKEDAVGKVAGVFGGSKGAEGGGSRSSEELAQLAFLEQSGRLNLEPKSSDLRNKKLADRALGRYATQVGTAFNREGGVQPKQELGRAQIEAVSGGSPSVNLREFANKFTPAGMDLDAVVKEVQHYGTVGELDDYTSRPRQRIRPEAGQFLQEKLGVNQEDLGVVAANPEVLATARAILVALESMNSKLDKVASQPPAASQPPVINNNYTSPRIYSNDSHAEQSRRSNGESVTLNAAK